MIQPMDGVQEQIVAALPRLRRFARTLTRSQHDADDVVQIAVERALRRIDQWQPESSLLSWLFGIVRNAWIDEARARTRRSKVLAPEEAGADIGDASAERVADLLAIQAALAQLPEEQLSA